MCRRLKDLLCPKCQYTDEDFVELGVAKPCTKCQAPMDEVISFPNLKIPITIRTSHTKDGATKRLKEFDKHYYGEPIPGWNEKQCGKLTRKYNEDGSFNET